MQYKDYYKILGVSRDATADEIKRAYRKLARKYHPDVSKEANAEDHFKDVQEAYEALKDQSKRAAYDNLGSQWQAGQEFRPPPNWQGFGDGGGFEDADLGGFSDFFANIFGARGPGGRRTQGFHQRGRDEHARIAVTLEEAYKGTTRAIQLQVPGSEIRTLKINIPAGVVAGQQLRLANQGSPGIGNAKAGDLFLEVEILPHRIFTLQGKDIYLSLPITPWEAALGAKVAVPTLGGSVEMKIAPASQTGQKLRLKGRGMPGRPQSGDQYILLQIVTPPAVTAEQRTLYEQMSKAMPFNPRTELFK
jgi:curved DNA-binding protein